MELKDLWFIPIEQFLLNCFIFADYEKAMLHKAGFA